MSNISNVHVVYCDNTCLNFDVTVEVQNTLQMLSQTQLDFSYTIAEGIDSHIAVQYPIDSMSIFYAAGTEVAEMDLGEDDSCFVEILSSLIDEAAEEAEASDSI